MTETKTPTPDPTVLTTDALRREIKASTDLTNAKLEALTRFLETKIDGNAALSEERHRLTRRELAAGEERRLEHKKDTKDNVDTAFAAAADQIKSVDSTVNDLKERVLRLETQQQTKIETRGDGRSGVMMIVGVIGSGVGLLALMIAAAALFMQ